MNMKKCIRHGLEIDDWMTVVSSSIFSVFEEECLECWDTIPVSLSEDCSECIPEFDRIT